jgi:hypothetical protein
MEIEAFAKQQRFLISTWHQDVWTGAGADALQQRPGLAAAIQQARSAKCPLIVSRLDRLSRNLHFISGLIEHRVHFIVAELGGVHDNFTLHIWASIAEQERKMLAERVTAALAAAKARGVKLGQAGRSKAEQRRCSRLANAKNSRSAMLRAQRYRAPIEWVLGERSPQGKPLSYRAAADKLNEKQLQSMQGARWSWGQVRQLAHRFGLRARQVRKGQRLKSDPRVRPWTTR